MKERGHSFSFRSFFFPQTTAKAITIITIVGVVVFSNSFINGFVGDDGLQIELNPVIRSLSNIPHFFSESTFYNGDVTQQQGLYYRPIMTSFYAILYVLFGPHAPVYHVFQVFVHICNTILIFLIFRYFFNPLIALALALLFLVHPINSETVAYIANLQDILFFFFGSLAFYLNLKMQERSWKYVLLSILLLLSVFSKETSVLFILVMLFYDFLYHKKQVIRLLLIALIVITVYIFFRIFVAHIPLQQAQTYAPIMHMSVIERVLNTPSVLLYYIKTTFLPIHLAISQQWTVTLQSKPTIFISILINVIFIATTFLLGKNIYYKNKNYFKQYVFFVFWFTIGLLLHSQIFFVLTSTVSDRWFYFPFIGLLGIFGILLDVYVNKDKAPQKVFIMIFVSVLVIFSLRTIVRNANYYDNLTLFSHDVMYSNESSVLHAGLGYELDTQQRYNEAELHLLKAIELDPKDSMSWNKLGNHYMQTGKIEKAKEAYLTAIKNGTYYKPYQALALYLFIYDTPETAEKFARWSLQRFPTNGTLWQYYALIENSLGNKKEARKAAKKAVMYLPNEWTQMIYERLSQNQSLEVQLEQTEKGKIMHICPPECIKK